MWIETDETGKDNLYAHPELINLQFCKIIRIEACNQGSSIDSKYKPFWRVEFVFADGVVSWEKYDSLKKAKERMNEVRDKYLNPL